MQIDLLFRPQKRIQIALFHIKNSKLEKFHISSIFYYTLLLPFETQEQLM